MHVAYVCMCVWYMCMYYMYMYVMHMYIDKCVQYVEVCSMCKGFCVIMFVSMQIRSCDTIPEETLTNTFNTDRQPRTDHIKYTAKFNFR